MNMRATYDNKVFTALCKITFLTNGKTFGPYGACSNNGKTFGPYGSVTDYSFLFPNGLLYFSGISARYLNVLVFNSYCGDSNFKLIIPTRGIDY